MYYSNQNIAINAIYDSYSRGTRYVCFIAPMQSGKTGTYQGLIRRMMHEYPHVDSCLILCGSNELTLLNQIENDTATYHKDTYYLDSVQVLFRQHFNKYMKSHKTLKNTLIIVDESHMVQDFDQSIDKFCDHFGITMAGHNEYLTENNIYILSVSATPYSEIASYYHKKSLPKNLVFLEPGPGYYGVEHFMKDAKIKNTFDINTNFDKFIRIIKKEKYKNKYCIMRINDIDTYDTVLALNGGPEKIRVLRFDSKISQIAMTSAEKPIGKPDFPCVETKPKQSTIVLIKGRLRAGKVLCKNHIGFIWEDSQEPDTDTVVQSLLGRMCGYYKTKHRPDIFVPECCTYINEDKTIEDSELERHNRALKGEHILPRDGRNLTKLRLISKPTIDRYPVVPIMLKLDSKYHKYVESINKTSEKRIMNECLKLLKQEISNITTGDERSELTLEHFGDQMSNIEEFLEMATISDCNIRRYSAERKFYRQFTKFYSAVKNKEISREPIAGCPECTFLIIYSDFVHKYSLDESLIGTVICQMYVENKYPFESVDIASRLPTPKPCIFTKLTEVILPELDAMPFMKQVEGYIIDQKEVMMKKEEHEKLTKTSIVIEELKYPEFLADIYRFNYSKYTSPIINAICKKLSAEYACKISVKFDKKKSKELKTASKFYISKISIEGITNDEDVVEIDDDVICI